MKRKRMWALLLSGVLLVSGPGGAAASEFGDGTASEADSGQSEESEEFQSQGQENKAPDFEAPGTEPAEKEPETPVVTDSEPPENVFSENQLPEGPVPVERSYFPDSRFRSWVAENIDRDSDGILSEKEIYDTKEITISGLGIDDIKGIQIFVKLEKLDCSGNLLRFLDLSSLSELVYLDCSDNGLNRLDFTGKEKLRTLKTAGNPMYSLDFGMLPLLEELDISRTNISSFDLSQNPELKSLSCTRTGVYELNLTGNPLLETLICNDNGIQELDGGALTELVYLDCSDSYMQRLNIASCKKLETLYCRNNGLEVLSLEGMNRLKNLDFSNNRIISINLKDCPLESLSCGGNLWVSEESVSLEGMDGIVPDSLQVVENGVMSEDKQVSAVDKALPVKVSCRYESGGAGAQAELTLYLGYLAESDFVNHAVFESASEQYPVNEAGRISRYDLEKVTGLTLAGKNISDLSDLKYFPNLGFLDCSDNPLAELDLSAVPRLRTLICTGTLLGSLDLRMCPLLDYAEVTGNELTSLNVSGLKSLGYLDCRFNRLGDIKTADTPVLKYYMKAPQSNYTVQVDTSNVISFSKLGNFAEQLQDGEVIADLKGMSYSADKKSFVMKMFTGSCGTGSFSIMNKWSGKLLGTCTVKAKPSRVKKPAPGKPVLTKLTGGDSVTLIWKKVNGITGYRVLRKEKNVKNAKWKQLVRLNSTRTRYTDKTGLLNKEYLYTVQTYAVYRGKTYYSRYDTKGLAGKAVLKIPVLLKAVSSPAPEVRWKEVKGADGYRVYRKKKGSTKWTRLADVSRGTAAYTDMEAAPGTVYYYTIRPFRSIGSTKSLGSYNKTGVSVKPAIAEGEIINVIRQREQFTVQWKRVEQADGYQLYRAEGETGAYTKTAELQGDGNLSYMDGEAFRAGNPYYKVRAYREIKGKHYYGPFSAARTVTEMGENADSYDFSEFHMGYELSSEAPEGFDRTVDEGGDFFMSTAYLARGSGPVSEWQVPYNNPYPAVYNSDIKPTYQLEEALYIPARKDSLDNAAIKQAVLKYGAVASNYFSDVEFYGQNMSNYYFPPGGGGHDGPVGAGGEPHAIAIVGWDDAYPKELFTTVPEGDGAFLCKNSWGMDFGDNGYFYISYYDNILGKQDFSAVFSKVGSKSSFRKTYQYDPLGATGTYGYEDELYQANVFPAEGAALKEAENLTAVSFYTYDAGYSYEVYVIPDYKGSASLEAPGEPKARGSFAYAGYHTVSLPQPVRLEAGSRFAVVLRVRGANGAMGYFEVPIANYSDKASSGWGQSYVSHHGETWDDINGYLEGTNACIKAYTDGKPEETEPRELLRSGRGFSVQEVLGKGFEINPDFVNRQSDFVPPASIGNTSEITISLPGKYDLRESGLVSPVKNQGSLGLCWAFATIASLESCMLVGG